MSEIDYRIAFIYLFGYGHVVFKGLPVWYMGIDGQFLMISYWYYWNVESKQSSQLETSTCQIVFNINYHTKRLYT